MEYLTYKEIKKKIREDLGLEQEEFITDNELMGYCNFAIDECESLIHTLYEDYFLSLMTINIEAGKAEYDLPAGIYANKIRGVVYTDGTRIYKVKRYKNIKDMFETIEYDKEYLTSTSDFKYLIMNTMGATNPVIQLVPTPSSDVQNGLKIYYIRNANKMVDDDSICDIPEFVDYVIQFAKTRCYEKEAHPNTELSLQMLSRKREIMENTLSNMTPDGDNLIQPDVDIYREME